jgi:hypothetical protein
MGASQPGRLPAYRMLRLPRKNLQVLGARLNRSESEARHAVRSPRNALGDRCTAAFNPTDVRVGSRLGHSRDVGSTSGFATADMAKGD